MPPPVDSGIRGSCPRCGAKTLFKSFTAFAGKCPSCGLDFSRFNVGDGPVVFMTLGIGALIVALALWVEFTFEPGILIHALLWIPLTLALVVVSLRFAKGLLLALEYRNRAEEARLKDPK
ncbi:MAG: DUF983 domain-containing protein [Sphingomonadales bacterium]|nr:MAG: DUF983 domain-containing protein [Sphingomonadales bacterium]